MRRPTAWTVATLIALAFIRWTAPAPAQEPPIPSAAEVEGLLRREPVTMNTWPAWRGRLLVWLSDRSDRTDAAYLAAHEFLRQQANAADGRLTPALADDAFAWYLLGSAYLYDVEPGPDLAAGAAKAEAALRESLRLDPKFARAHRNLAEALLLQPPPKPDEGRRELDEARRLDPSLPLSYVEAKAAVLLGNYAEADNRFQAAVAENPHDVRLARAAAQAVCLGRNRPGGHAAAIQPLCDRFPDDGTLVCFHGLALAIDGDSRAALRRFDHARALGTDPASVLPAELIAQIEEAGAPTWPERLGWVMLGFAGFYAVVMLLMAFAGLILAAQTRGGKALELLGSPDEELVAGGQVRRVGHESLLAKLYVAALALGLVLFYAAIPFIVAGLVGATLGLLHLMLTARRIDVRAVILVAALGIGCVWAVFKGLFASAGKGSFGLMKTPEECPRLFDAVTEVARRVDTPPVDHLYLAPGSSIGVHQEGRGPFGMFGVKRRVLTLGLSTMHYLTVDELKAILAHEYAHFSHADTAVNRFVYQVALTIGETLKGMGEAGGWLNYVNPFYWFLVLYHKSYSVLSAGYSRSREYLADRMAASLYGPEVFRSALTKVMTDGTLFEMTIYDNIAKLLAEDKAFVNMYESFKSFRDEQLKAEQRQELYDKLLDEKASLFASHPTFGERVAALASFPSRPPADAAPARTLFEDPEAIERELTEFLTAFIAHVQQLQARAQQQAG